MLTFNSSSEILLQEIDCGEHASSFGSGGGEQLAVGLQASLLKKITIDTHICTRGNVVQPTPMAEIDSLVAQGFTQIATALNATFCPQVR